jgi:hypothetical protein
MKVRNKSENAQYVNCIKAITSDINQVIDGITYEAHPELNQRTIAKLKEAVRILEAVAEAPIFKP